MTRILGQLWDCEVRSASFFFTSIALQYEVLLLLVARENERVERGSTSIHNTRRGPHEQCRLTVNNICWCKDLGGTNERCERCESNGHILGIVVLNRGAKCSSPAHEDRAWKPAGGGRGTSATHRKPCWPDLDHVQSSCDVLVTGHIASGSIGLRIISVSWVDK